MLGGGVETVVMNYYRHIDRDRYQFDLLIDSDSTHIPFLEVEAMGGRIIKIPPYQHQMAYQHELKHLFRQEGWDIVHSHINAMSVFPLHAAQMAGVPVRIAHSHSTSGVGEYTKNVVKNFLKPFSKTYANVLVACSQYAGEWLFGKDVDFFVLRNAVDTQLFAPNEAVRLKTRRLLGISPETLVVGHIGRFTTQKNHAYLLKIFRAIKQLECDSVLLCAGEGPLIEAAKERASDLGIADSVRFLGQFRSTQDLYQAFDVFCLPSLYEGLPMVGVECQASHTPILASDVITSEAAFTSLMEFEPLASEPHAWAEHLLAMRGETFNPEDEVGVRGFDIAANASRLQSMYDTLLEGIQ